MAAVGSLGYHPSAIARSLKLRSTRTLGLLITDIANPYFPEIVRAVEDAALRRGQAVLLCNGADDPEREEMYLELLVQRRVDGIIIASSGLQERHRDWLTESRVPVVLVNCTSSGAPLDAVLTDNHVGGRLATEHLLALGHRRLGHLSAPDRYAAAGERLGGILEAAGSVDPPAQVTVVEADARVEGGERATEELLGRAPDVTAILCYNDLTAIGALRALRAGGRAVPGDISVVGYDDIPLAAYVEPPLTTIAQRTADMGRWAVERLLERVTSRAEDPDAAVPAGEVCRLPVELRVRGSTAAPRPGEPAGSTHDGAPPRREPALPRVGQRIRAGAGGCSTASLADERR